MMLTSTGFGFEQTEELMEQADILIQNQRCGQDKIVFAPHIAMLEKNGEFTLFVNGSIILKIELAKIGTGIQTIAKVLTEKQRKGHWLTEETMYYLGEMEINRFPGYELNSAETIVLMEKCTKKIRFELDMIKMHEESAVKEIYEL